jgi:hypothetical protein
MLQKLGYQSDVASNGIEAVNAGHARNVNFARFPSKFAGSCTWRRLSESVLGIGFALRWCGIRKLTFLAGCRLVS